MAHDRTKLRRAGTVIAIALGTPALLFLIYKFTLGRPVLVGPATYDFGTVVSAESKVTLAHTFEFTNRLGAPIEILEIKASCGCVVPRLSTNVVEPGGALQVPFTFTLEKPGVKGATIALLMKSRGARRIEVQANLQRPAS